MQRRCAVKGCVQKKLPSHRFPNPQKELERFKTWISACDNSKLATVDPMRIYDNTRVCHIHFKESDIMSGIHISKTSVPSLHLPVVDDLLCEFNTDLSDINLMVKTCNKCFDKVKIYVTCFKCGTVYHAKCLMKIPGKYVNEEGHIFCCKGVNSMPDGMEKKVGQRNLKKYISEERDGDENDPRNFNTEDINFQAKNYVCDLCNLRFKEEDSLNSHYKICILKKRKVKDAGNKNNSYKCRYCHYFTDSEDDFAIHCCDLMKRQLVKCKCDELQETSCKCKPQKIV